MTFLSDQETKVDLLNNEAIASTIVELLCEGTDRPVTVGVHGDWGAGKSSILEMIEDALESRDNVLCLKFNGWRFQGFEDAKIALIEGIVTGLIEQRPLLRKATGVVKDVYRRIDWLKVAKKAGGLALTAFTGIPTPDQLQSIVSVLEGTLADPAKLATKENVAAALDDARSLLTPEGQSKSVPEEIGAFRKAFAHLLKEAEIDLLVILIDDLDRCLPDTAIETLEALRLFVLTSHTAFVVAADEPMIEYAVRKHFPDLPDTTGPQTYARSYLEKLIQVPFRIPALGETETRFYVTLLLIGVELGQDDPEFIGLIAAARKLLKRPWESGTLDAATVRKALGDKASKAQNAIILSDQIGPTLASGTKGNPRQIKRFINSLLLRQSTAKARGFADQVKLPVLAKLMLAERFLPRLFDQVASGAAASSNGYCEELAVLEASMSEEAEPSTTRESPVRHKNARDKKPARRSARESPLLTEWLSSKAIKAWALVRPSLTQVDLRPYLFVTKDKKDYFGAVSILGHLSVVAEQLCGPKITVQSLKSELERLAEPEAAQVFEAIRGRIINGDAFETEPAGIAGLIVLVKAHPELQGNLLDLLEGLPKDRLGPWAVKGWEGVIHDTESLARFHRLLDSWAKSARNEFLKTAAAGTRQLTREVH